MRKKAATYWPVCHAHLRLQSCLHNFNTVEPTWKPWVRFSVRYWSSQHQQKSFVAFYHNLSLNRKHRDFTYIQEWIIIEDIFNFFFLPTAFEDDAIAVPVSAAAVASHYWYVLMFARLSGDKLINADASQSQRDTTAGYFELYTYLTDDYPEVTAVVVFLHPKTISQKI